jgi:hypothetical protein
MIIIKKIIKLKKESPCSENNRISPNEWECHTEENDFIYIRYKLGVFKVLTGKNIEIAKDENKAFILMRFYWTSHMYPNDLSTARMVELTRDILDFNICSIEDELLKY